METIDKLVELKTQREDAFKAFKENEKETANALIDLIKMHCCPEGAELVIDFHVGTPWRCKEDGRYEFSGKIGFKTDDEKRLANGWTTDFGSDFDIHIFENGGIEINKGTCGSYRRKDKFQVFRDRMLGMLWDIEDVIVACMTSHFNFELYNKFQDIDLQIDRIENNLKRAKEQREYEAVVKQVKTAKYLYKLSIIDKYENDDYWTHKKIGTHHHFYDFFIIEKVTEKSVIGHYENYSWQQKRLDLGSVVYEIKSKQKLCGLEKPEDYVEPLVEAEG